MSKLSPKLHPCRVLYQTSRNVRIVVFTPLFATPRPITQSLCRELFLFHRLPSIVSQAKVRAMDAKPLPVVRSHGTSFSPLTLSRMAKTLDRLSAHFARPRLYLETDGL